MGKTKFKCVDHVVRWRLCMGCGVCVGRCPSGNIQLVDFPEEGLRAVVDKDSCEECGKCIEVCPGIGMSHGQFADDTIAELRDAWGPVLEIWQGYASDPDIRYKGSSGGAASALALFCLEEGLAESVFHVGEDPQKPLANKALISKNRDDLLACSGSRYSPAGLCEEVELLREQSGSCVVIGKPCDVVAIKKLREVDAEIDSKTRLTISIFCAGTPSMSGTYGILEAFNVKPGDVAGIRYRGCGWPGQTTVTVKGDTGRTEQMAYSQAWGDILSKHGQFRCRMCPDSTGEFADISCGDPWYLPMNDSELGRSLVLVRTEKGREVLHKAMKSGYLELQEVGPEVVGASQRALLNRRRHLWGRFFAMKMFGIPVPVLEGFSLFTNWLPLPVYEKVKSVGGTLRRIVSRRWFRPDGRDFRVPQKEEIDFTD